MVSTVRGSEWVRLVSANGKPIRYRGRYWPFLLRVAHRGAGTAIL